MTGRWSVDTLLMALALALLVSLPFEPVRPLAVFGGFELNHLKLLLAAAAVVWALETARTSSRSAAPWRERQTNAPRQNPQTSATWRNPQTSTLPREPRTIALWRSLQSIARSREPPTSALGRNPQTSALWRNPQSSALGRNPQTRALGRNPQTSALGRNPQTGALGRNPQSSALGRNPQTSALGRNPQSSALGRNPQTSALGRNPQTSALWRDPQTGALGRNPGGWRSGALDLHRTYVRGRYDRRRTFSPSASRLRGKRMRIVRPQTSAVWREPQNITIALLLGAALLSAALAPSHRVEATRFVGRFASGLFVLLLARQLIATRPERVRPLLWAICIGAGASALIGFGEIMGLQQLAPILGVFKLAPTHVGGVLRLSASFQYATIAAMYFELVTPLAIVLAVTSTSLPQKLLAAAIALMCSAAVALTLTRAGIVALAAVCSVLLVLAAFRPRFRNLRVPTALAATAAALALAILALRLPDFTARFGTENDWGWYAASYSAPESLTLEQGTPTQAVVSAHNTGQALWTTGGDHPFALAYRWLSADDSAQLQLPPTVLDLPVDVPPGSSVQLTIDVGAAQLPPGDYRLAWGMLQQRVLWFHDRGNPDAETAVHVAAALSTTVTVPLNQEPRTDTSLGLAPVPRSELWRAALRMFSDRPLIGVGPDNFRHLYGAYLGMPLWDQRVHANNLYLELFADVGVVGTVAFGLVLAPAARELVRSVRLYDSLLLAGLGASLVAFFVHGTLDYFLDFTPIYVLFWLIVGLGTAFSRHLEKQC